MDSDTSRITGSFILLLSLLLHILILLLIFIFQSPSHDAQINDAQTVEYFDANNQLQNNQLTPQQQQAQQQDDDTYDPDHEILVELLSQGVQPNDTLTDDPGELPQPAGLVTPQLPTPDTASSDQEEETPEDESPAEDAADSSDDTPTPPAEQPQADQRPADEPAKGSSEKQQPISDTISGSESPQQAPKPVVVKKAAKKIVRKIAQRPPMHPADVKMLSKIAQGFMESMCAELGNAPSNDPTQLAHQRYMTKLWNNLKQAMNAENNVLALASNVDTKAVLVMTINKQGKLLNALLRHPHKTMDISKMESMLITNAHKAGLFPPLPASFKREEVTFVMPIHLRAQEGIHSGYRLQVEQ